MLAPSGSANMADKLNAEKAKKDLVFKSLLYAKKIDRAKLKECFLDNYNAVPQEHRLAFWKSMLGKLEMLLVKRY